MMRVPATATVPIDHQMPMLTTLDRHFISMMVLCFINLLYLFIPTIKRTVKEIYACFIYDACIPAYIYNLYVINE